MLFRRKSVFFFDFLVLMVFFVLVFSFKLKNREKEREQNEKRKKCYVFNWYKYCVILLHTSISLYVNGPHGGQYVFIR